MKSSLWDLLTNIKNSQTVKKAFIIHPKKKICAAFLNILWDEGFILGYKIYSEHPHVFKIFLKYKNGTPCINSLISITTPSLRKYYSLNQLWKIKARNDLIIISTNKGLYTLQDCKKFRLGGELFTIIR